MKIFTKILSALFIFSLGISANAFSAISYVSAGAGPSDWNNSATWSPVGIPTTADAVTISAGHTVNISTNGNVCKDLTINGTLAWTSNVALTCYGNYSVSASGAESTPVYGKLSFFAPGTTVNVSGTSSSKLYYNFASNRTLTGTINKTSAFTTIGASKTVTNLGNYTMGNITASSGCGWINGTNSFLSLRLVGFMASRTFTANAVGNTVKIVYTTGVIPTTTSGFYNLQIASTATGTKTLSTNTILAGSLTINSNNTLNSNNFDLTVGKNWTSSGTFTASAGKTVTFNGTTAQTMSNSTGTTTFKRIAISNTNGLTLTTGTYILDEVLTISNGTFNTGGRPFTMTSTATQTARIAPITGTGAISGNFTIQRFITARDTTFADLSSPVQSSTFADWESELVFINYVSTPPTSQASAATYDETAYAYVPVTSSGTAISPGTGYEVFLSGGYTYTNFPATTINTVGTPNQGDHDLSFLISNSVQGWNLVGNPFASSISWTSIYNDAGTNGLYDYIEMYDYTIADWNGYTTADAIEIGSTQGFWVYGLLGNGAVSLNIPESSKTTTANSSIKTAAIIQPYFTLKLGSSNSTNAHIFKVAATDVAKDGLDAKDIPYRKSINKATPEMYCMLEGKKININNFNLSNDSYSIPLKTKVAISGNYKIEAAGFDFVQEYTCIKLQDNLTGKTIDLTEGNGYNILMNATDDEDRFILHFSKNNNCKTAIVATTTFSNFENQVEVLPTTQGNVINFNLSETTNTSISVVNMLGQTIVESMTIAANNQSVNIDLPEGFSGLYIVKVESTEGAVTKKFVKK